MRRASVPAASDPRVTSPATSIMMEKMSFMFGLLVRIVDAGIGADRRKRAVSSPFGRIAAAVINS